MLLESLPFCIKYLKSSSTSSPKKITLNVSQLVTSHNGHAQTSSYCILWFWEEREMVVLQTHILCVQISIHDGIQQWRVHPHSNIYLATMRLIRLLKLVCVVELDSSVVFTPVFQSICMSHINNCLLRLNNDATWNKHYVLYSILYFVTHIVLELKEKRKRPHCGDMWVIISYPMKYQYYKVGS